MKYLRIISMACLLVLVACEPVHDTSLPSAVIREAATRLHDENYTDPYAYLSNAEDPDTRAYLASELEYASGIVAGWGSDRRMLEREINALLPEAALSQPLVIGDWEYSRELKPGSQYPVYWRRSIEDVSVRQTILDLSLLAGDSDYFEVGGFSVGPSDSVVAYTEDRVGDQRYTLRGIDLEAGSPMPLSVGDLGARVVWLGDRVLVVAEEGKTVLSVDPGTGIAEVLHRETDKASVLSIHAARDNRQVFVTSVSHDSTEIHRLDEAGDLHLVAPRRSGHHYRVRMLDETYYLYTNYRKPGFEVARANVGVQDPETWDYLDLAADRIEDFEVFHGYWVVQTRQAMTSSIYVIEMKTGNRVEVVRSEAGGAIRLAANPDPASQTLRFEKTSVFAPRSIHEYAFSAGQAVIGDGEKAVNYIAEMIWLTASDDRRVPVTLLYGKSRKAAPRPGLVTAYGAYGISASVDYDPRYRLLLDRGGIIAIIHVRGGGELGPGWHEAGSRLSKQRGVNDLIEGTQYLIQRQLIAPGRIVARGSSAGATLVAAAINQAPGLFAAAVLKVPFLDPVNTLLDASLPLSVSDHLEWGDPRIPEEYDVIRRISPYETIRQQAHPDIMVVTSENDSRVAYSESLKWLAKLRQADTSGSQKLFVFEEDAGHFGTTDQLEMRRRDSLEYTFILRSLNIPVTPGS